MAQTNDACFLCFQNSSFDSEAEPELELQTYSIRYIAQYLKTPVENQNYSIPSKEKVNGSILKTPEEDYLVRLCCDCAAVVSNISSQIQLLELTQLKINYNIQQLNKLLEAQPSKREHLPETIPKSKTGLRKNLEQKCAALMNKITQKTPVVQLDRIVIEESSKNIECTDDDSDFDNTLQFQDTYNGSSETESDASDSSKLNAKSSPTNSSSGIKLSKLFKQYVKINKQKTLAECVLCEKRQHDKRQWCIRFSNHLICSHLEKVFSKQKLPQVTPEHYKFYCNHALRTEMSCLKRLQTENGRKLIRCPMCNFQKCAQMREKMRRHIVTHHYKILEEKIVNLQKSGNVKNLAKIDLPGIRAMHEKSDCENWKRLNLTCGKLFKPVPDKPSKSKCLLCNQLVQAINPRLHLVTHHPETLFENCKPTSIELNPDQFSNLCKHILHIESSQRERVCSNSSKNSGYAYKCHLCDVKFYNLALFRYHLASKHFHALRDRMEKLTKAEIQILIKDNPKNRRNCKLYKRSKHIQSFLDQLKNRLYTEYCFKWKNSGKCKTCKSCLGDSNVVLEHFLDKHIQVVFRDMKLENVTEKQFEICCQRVMDKEVRDAEKELGFRCGYCKSGEIKECNELRFHLVAKHFTVLEEIVVRSQTEQKWNEVDEGEDKASQHFAKRRKLDEKCAKNKVTIEIECVKNECMEEADLRDEEIPESIENLVKKETM